MGLRERGSHGRVWAVAGVLLLVSAGCANVEKKPAATELLWPPPPLTSRIKFVGVLRNQDDLKKSGGTVFMDALLGKKKGAESLDQPMGVALSGDGKRLYVSDYVKRSVFVFNFETRRVSFLGGAAIGFKRPFGVAVDGRDNVYVVDSAQRLIRVFDPKGKFLRDIPHEGMERPTGIAIDPSRQRIYVADSSRRKSKNHVIHVMDMNGDHINMLGGRGTEDGKFYFPTYLTVDGRGNLYVADTLNARVQVFDPDGRRLWKFGQRGDGFGMFDKPKGVAVDSFGNLYVVDSTWSNVQIFNQRKQPLLYFAGRGMIPGLLFNPTGIAIDKDNRIYVADMFNGRIAIYQLINTRAEDSFLVQAPRTKSDQSKEAGGS